MAVFNGERFLTETLETVLSQTFSDFEFIIVNDGSTDRTKRILEQVQDSRVKCIHLEENKGVGHATHLAMQLVSGEFVAKVDSDDLYENTRFEKQVSFLDANPNIALVDAKISYFPDNLSIAESQRYLYIKKVLENQVNSVCTTEHISEKLYWFPCISHTSIMFRSSILEKVTYNPDLRIGEDYDFFYRLNKQDYKMFKLPEVLTKFRISSESTTVTENHKLFDGVFAIKNEELLRIKQSKKSVFIWGTGELGRITLEFFSSQDMHVEGFLDSNAEKHDQLFHGKAIMSIDHINLENSYIVIASTVGKFDIVAQLSRRDMKHLKDFFVIF